MSLQQVLCASFLMLITAEYVYSHHARTPVFDGSRVITVEGLVTEFRLINPHASISLDVTDGDGNVVTWSIELPGKLNLSVGSWTDESVNVGERVVISGNPTHTGSSGLWLTKLWRADGRELLLPGAERTDALEEERRRRIEERNQRN